VVRTAINLVRLQTPLRAVKTCAECGVVKSVDKFHLHPNCCQGVEPMCKLCRRKKAKTWSASNPGKQAEYAARYRDRHPEYKERENARRRALTEENPGRYSEVSKARYYKNKAEYFARNVIRRGIVKQQTPRWADMKAIAAFYAACPPGYHVDHVIPLRGKTVNGLHVLENLQYLPAHENMRKHNRLTD